MVDLIKQIGEIGAINVVVCTVLVCMLVVGAVSLKDQLFDKLGILTKKSLRENKINQQLEENTSRIKKLETDFKDMEENLYKKQEEYHEQSVSVRENLRGSQNDLKESLKELRSMMLDKEIDDMRWELLNFANAVINKEIITKSNTTMHSICTQSTSAY